MHYDWFGLARSGAVPFLKVELLRDNPVRIPGVARWNQVLAGSDYPAHLISDHLRRLGPRHSAMEVGPLRRAKWRARVALLSRDRWRMLRG